MNDLMIIAAERENQRFLSFKMMDAYARGLCELPSCINSGAAECGL